MMEDSILFFDNVKGPLKSGGDSKLLYSTSSLSSLLTLVIGRLHCLLIFYHSANEEVSQTALSPCSPQFVRRFRLAYD